MLVTRTHCIVGPWIRDAPGRGSKDGLKGNVPSHYELTVKGQPGELLRAAFEDVVVTSGPGGTILSAELDQPALHGLLARVEDLGLELLHIPLLTDDGDRLVDEEP